MSEGDGSDGATDPERGEPTGPWLLALGALAVGVLAILASALGVAVRWVRRRRDDADSRRPSRRR